MTQTDNFDEMLGTLRATEPYIEDDGFTSAVMARLPEARQLPFWASTLILLGFTAIGSAIAAWLLPVRQLISTAMTPLSALPGITSLPVLGSAALLTFVLSYVITWMAQTDKI